MTRIHRVIAHPLSVRLAKTQTTGARAFPVIELVIVEVVTEGGLVGWGECLGRTGSPAYAAIIERILAPTVIGEDALAISRLHRMMMRTLSGRAGGMLMEAIAGVDIALWDIAGKAARQPIHRLLGGEARGLVEAYASSINWTDDDEARAELEAALAFGFRTIKVKVGKPIGRAMQRIALMRRIAGDKAALAVDANCAYSRDEAREVAAALADNGYLWFEEPIEADDVEGYRRLRGECAIMLAAGEGDFTARQARELVADRSVGLIQPDVARAGGITETRRIAELAHIHHVAYAPHVGWSGAICAAASLQMAAAMSAFRCYECMVFENPLRNSLLVELVGERSQLVDGMLPVPVAPGLGVDVDRAALGRFKAT
jgi:L-alanine-DL-glutamate epimerase-like enolase superfamily enzyme